MMIAALAGTTQAKNNAMHAIGLDLRWRRFQSQGTSELGAIERDERMAMIGPTSATGPTARANLV
jgi:hypothetical protein